MTNEDPGEYIDDHIRDVLAGHGRLLVDVRALADEDDLFRAGMSSRANVWVMLALEEHFGVEFPEHMQRRGTFKSMHSIRSAIAELLEGRAWRAEVAEDDDHP